MAASISSLTSSFSSLSFSSSVTPRPQRFSFAYAKPRSPTKSAGVKRLVVTATSAAAVPAEVETKDLQKYVKSRLPGGFAAQTIIATGRRKCAIARVVLQEGTGKFFINYRDAKALAFQNPNPHPHTLSPSMIGGRPTPSHLPTASARPTSLTSLSNFEYLQGNPLWLQYIKTPLITLGYETSYDVFVRAHGGGLSGQAQAILLGVARALLKVSESHRATLREEGFLTRDPRVVERKKAGLKKARKAPQYSKR